jgi:hypothetical protein
MDNSEINQAQKETGCENESALSKAEDLVFFLQFCGVQMDDDKRAEAIELLSSPKILDSGMQELGKLLSIDKNDKDLMMRLAGASREFYDKYGELLHKPLAIENSKIFLGKKVELAGHQDAEVDGETIDMADLSDPEVAGLGEEEIKRIIEEIIKGKEGSAGQGMFWNVLVPKDIPYVLKTQRRQDSEGLERHSRDSLLRYPIIRKYLADFLPKQAVLQTDESEQLHILQEKVPIRQMTSVLYKNVDALIDGKYGQEIDAALKSDKNKEKLRAFISGVEDLYREHKLMIDAEGDNIFFSVDQDGELTIKLIDYGASKHWDDEEPSEHIEKSLEFINKLKSAYL